MDKDTQLWFVARLASAAIGWELDADAQRYIDWIYDELEIEGAAL